MGLLLYIHPYNHVLDELVPMGAVSIMNRVDVPKAGRYAWHVTDEDVAAASVVAMDLHWYFGIESVRWIARDLKRLRPELPIVLGGITASFYARHLVESYPIDFVIQGDAEHAFPRLVEALFDGRTPPPLPNVWTKEAAPPTLRAVTPREYDENDTLTLDWFPELQARTHAAHARFREQPFWREMDRYHPYIPLNRGCRFPCNNCYGSYQRDAFGAGQVDRSAASLARLLDEVEKRPEYAFVNFIAGTEDMARLRPWRDVFARKRALGAYIMHFCDLPSDADLDMLLGGFETLAVDFTNPGEVPLPLRAAGLSITDAEDRIVAIARRLDRIHGVHVGISFMSTEPHPFKDRLRAFEWERVTLIENSEWTLPRPNHATLSAADDLPEWPLAVHERPPLSPARREARDQAKAAQAEQFREVSRGHGRYMLARALAPGLHAVLDLSYGRRIDGEPERELPVDDAAVQAFVDAYVARYRAWFVATLEEVEVRVVGLPEPIDEPGLHTVARWGTDLGRAVVYEAFDGMRLTWRGAVPVGTCALAVVARLRWSDQWLDPRELIGLVHHVLPVRAGEVGLAGRVSPEEVHLSLHRPEHVDPDARDRPGPALVEAVHVLTERPASPFDPPEAAQGAAAGPTDLIESRWEDARWPRRVGRLIDALASRGMISGWNAEPVECSDRWVRHDWAHHSGMRARTFVLPAGDTPCVWRGARSRLVVQDVDDADVLEGAPVQALLRQLVEALSTLERR